MALGDRVIDEAAWQGLYELVRQLPPVRQEEIIDYINFIAAREEEDWELTAEDEAAIERHLAGDTSDTLRLEDVKDKILRGDVDDL